MSRTVDGDAVAFVGDLLAGGRQVVSVGPATPVQALDVAASGTPDPLRQGQWALDETSFEAAWRCGDGTGAVVAVLDTGVDVAHPDLAGRVVAGPAFLGGGGGAVEGGGGVDPHGHGTHVAGIIAAGVGNGVGVSGAAPGAEVVSVRVLDGGGGGWDSDIANGIVWAADNGADVVNLSLASWFPMPATEAAIGYAVSRGVVVLAAAGNSNTPGSWLWPAAYEQAVAVASTSAGGVVSAFSTSAAYVDVAAPGGSVLSTLAGSLAQQAGSRYGTLSGTSMATPHVAALAALLVPYMAQRNPGAVTLRLCVGAEDLGVAGADERSGCGVIDPLAAVLGTAPTAQG